MKEEDDEREEDETALKKASEFDTFLSAHLVSINSLRDGIHHSLLSSTCHFCILPHCSQGTFKSLPLRDYTG